MLIRRGKQAFMIPDSSISLIKLLHSFSLFPFSFFLWSFLFWGCDDKTCKHNRSLGRMKTLRLKINYLMYRKVIEINCWRKSCGTGSIRNSRIIGEWTGLRFWHPHWHIREDDLLVVASAFGQHASAISARLKSYCLLIVYNLN